MFLVITLNAQSTELLNLLKGKLHSTYTFVRNNKDTSYLDCYSNRLFIERTIHREENDAAYAAVLGIRQHVIDTVKSAFFVCSNFDDFSYIQLERRTYGEDYPNFDLIIFKLQSQPYHQSDYDLFFGNMIFNHPFNLTRFVGEESIRVKKEEFCAYKFVVERNDYGTIKRDEIYIDVEHKIPIYNKTSRIDISGDESSIEMKIINIQYYPR